MVPPGEAIATWPPGFSVTVLVTPLVVTETGCPTISAPGVQAWASAAPGNAATAISPIAIRATNRFCMTPLSSLPERDIEPGASGRAVGTPIVVHRQED